MREGSQIAVGHKSLVSPPSSTTSLLITNLSTEHILNPKGQQTSAIDKCCPEEQTLIQIATIIGISKMSQMNFDDGERPKYENKELTDNDLLIIYAFCRFDYYERQLDDFEKRSIFRRLLFNDTADLPDVANTFKDLNHPVTQKVAQVAEKTKVDSDELRRRVTLMYHAL